MPARRPLITATAAGTLLCALWFVPSANATGDEPDAATTSGPSAPASASPAANSAGSADSSKSSAESGAAEAADPAEAGSNAAEPDGATNGLVLADTGSVDTTPYLVGGTGLLIIGAGFVTYSLRAGRATTERTTEN